MKKTLPYLIVIFFGLSILYSCQKTPDAIQALKKSCLYNNKIDYFKKWSNTFTEVDTYTSAGAIQNKSFIYPYGYFQLSSNSTYNVLSDNVPLAGTWTVTDSCKLELDPGTSLDRKFDVLELSNDSLTLRQKIGTTVYTQHYVAFACPDITRIENQWDNTDIVEQAYNSTSILSTSYVYPVGYFKLNSDLTYNVLSDGVPLNGTWQLDPNGCQLVLDKNTSIQRAFDIQLLTPDSLTIWRKDTIARMNYLQHYKKH